MKVYIVQYWDEGSCDSDTPERVISRVVATEEQAQELTDGLPDWFYDEFEVEA